MAHWHLDKWKKLHTGTTIMAVSETTSKVTLLGILIPKQYWRQYHPNKKKRLKKHFHLRNKKPPWCNLDRLFVSGMMTFLPFASLWWTVILNSIGGSMTWPSSTNVAQETESSIMTTATATTVAAFATIAVAAMINMTSLDDMSNTIMTTTNL